MYKNIIANSEKSVNRKKVLTEFFPDMIIFFKFWAKAVDIIEKLKYNILYFITGCAEKSAENG